MPALPAPTSNGRWIAARRHLTLAGMAATPAAVVLLLIIALIGGDPRDHVPRSVWNDEIVYWNETDVFRVAGFNGGYHTVHEQPARVEASRFGPHGPAFAVFHGLIAKVTGWGPATPFFINLVVVTLAAFAWLRGAGILARPGRADAAAMLLLATFWPLLLFLPSNMQEPTHFAFAFLFALVLERHGRAATIAGAALVVVASLFRPSWAFMLLPLGWRWARERGWWAVGALGVATVVAGGLAYRVFDALASPGYPNSLHVLLDAWSASPGAAFGVFRELVTENLGNWFSAKDAWSQIVFRWFVTLFVVALAARWLLARPGEAHARAIEFALVTIVPILLVTLLVGEVKYWRDFRLLAPHLLVSMLVLVPHARWERWLWVSVLLLLPWYHRTFRGVHAARFIVNDRVITAMRAALPASVRFDPDASPWENTILVHADLLLYPLLAVPSGIALSYVLDWSDVRDPFRSAYLLLRPEDVAQVEHRVRLEPLADTPLGTLYRNAGPVTATGTDPR